MQASRKGPSSRRRAPSNSSFPRETVLRERRIPARASKAASEAFATPSSVGRRDGLEDVAPHPFAPSPSGFSRPVDGREREGTKPETSLFPKRAKGFPFEGDGRKPSFQRRERERHGPDDASPPCVVLPMKRAGWPIRGSAWRSSHELVRNGTSQRTIPSSPRVRNRSLLLLARRRRSKGFLPLPLPHERRCPPFRNLRTRGVFPRCFFFPSLPDACTGGASVAPCPTIPSPSLEPGWTVFPPLVFRGRVGSVWHPQDDARTSGRGTGSERAIRDAIASGLPTPVPRRMKPHEARFCELRSIAVPERVHRRVVRTRSRGVGIDPRHGARCGFIRRGTGGKGEPSEDDEEDRGGILPIEGGSSIHRVPRPCAVGPSSFSVPPNETAWHRGASRLHRFRSSGLKGGDLPFEPGEGPVRNRDGSVPIDLRSGTTDGRRWRCADGAPPPASPSRGRDALETRRKVRGGARGVLRRRDEARPRREGRGMVEGSHGSLGKRVWSNPEARNGAFESGLKRFEAAIQMSHR